MLTVMVMLMDTSEPQHFDPSLDLAQGSDAGGSQESCQSGISRSD